MNFIEAARLVIEDMRTNCGIEEMEAMTDNEVIAYVRDTISLPGEECAGGYLFEHQGDALSDAYFIVLSEKDSTLETVEYADVVFLQGDDANEAFAVADAADDFREALLAHLSGWDYGEYGVTRSESPHGNYDDTYETPEYVLSWNRALGYCGLTAKIASS